MPVRALFRIGLHWVLVDSSVQPQPLLNDHTVTTVPVRGACQKLASVCPGLIDDVSDRCSSVAYAML